MFERLVTLWKAPPAAVDVVVVLAALELEPQPPPRLVGVLLVLGSETPPREERVAGRVLRTELLTVSATL